MTLDEKLEQARLHAEGYGDKRGLKETADDYLKGVYAQLYGEIPIPDATVAEKDAWVRRQPEYKEAIVEKQNRYADWTAAELYVKILFAEVEKYRTDEATNRAMDRMHQ